MPRRHCWIEPTRSGSGRARRCRRRARRKDPMDTDLAGGRILVVDDDRVNRMLLTRSLEHEGHRVHCAENGAEALELLHDDPCDVVLLDIVMPELDGVPVLDHMKGDPALQDAPVIMSSGAADPESLRRCI